ncbi:hypothetical protein GPECTOR_39g431 [Gonium pectorale]|uniref:Uncharacterized protein n=1 Tax=Gonium pectorale TaxID=33097 RepID=A0A150GAR5_GONPE|nr:hypothetical protein GPECTOR_39g431 [Gonium pectorale]|eukprot:KXZ46937.1 hypothetical protein GPECTOR_39g431 [Gonium pectorale]
MARASNRGPRADIALLRKLKADPNFSPSSLLNAGSDILEKANKLKGFVSEQRGKLGASAAKTEWLLAYQQLQSDQDDAERELTACLQQLAEQPHGRGGGGPAGGPASASYSASASNAELRDEAALALGLLASHSDSVRSERQRLRSQGEISALASELEAALARLTEEAATLSADLRDSWPSAMAGGGGGGGEAMAPAAAGDDGAQGGAGPHAQEWSAELEGMMACYPLASPDVKERIREVFAALQEKYLEQLETWRLEVERAVAALTAGSGAGHPSSASPVTVGSAAAGPGRPSPARPGQIGAAAGRSKAAASAAATGPAGRGLGRPAGGQPGRGPASGVTTGSTDGLGQGIFKTALPHTFEAGVGPSGGADDAEGADAARRAGAAGAGGAAGGGQAPGSAAAWLLSGCGGWSADEHSAFLRHRERLMREAGATGAK